MDSFKIEKGIPIPPIPRRRKGFTATALQMEIGDSMKIPYASSVADLNKRYAPKNFRVITINGQLRMWRVA
jgi:hypothetical protein